MATDRDAGRMDLREARICKSRPTFVGAPDGGCVAVLCIGRKIEHISITARRKHYSITRIRFDPSGHEVSGHNASSLALNDNEIEHFGPRIHLDRSAIYLALKSLVRSEQKLLSCLASRIESSRNLRTSKRSIIEKSTVFARKGHTLRYALINYVHAELGQTIDIRFPRTKIAPFHRVVEETIDTVTIVTIILSRVDTSLSGYTVGASRAVVIAEAENVVTQLGERSGSGRPAQTRTNHTDRVLTLIGWVDELHLEAMMIPLLFDWARRHFRIQFHGIRPLTI